MLQVDVASKVEQKLGGDVWVAAFIMFQLSLTTV